MQAAMHFPEEERALPRSPTKVRGRVGPGGTAPHCARACVALRLVHVNNLRRRAQALQGKRKRQPSNARSDNRHALRRRLRSGMI